VSDDVSYSDFDVMDPHGRPPDKIFSFKEKDVTPDRKVAYP
jgi:hypothetical protein